MPDPAVTGLAVLALVGAGLAGLALWRVCRLGRLVAAGATRPAVSAPDGWAAPVPALQPWQLPL